MALTVEVGSGLRVANSYVATAFITAYLTDLGRQTENTWSTATSAQMDAAAIAATQYIDTRWGARFKGARNTQYTGVFSQALIAFTGIPIADETITIGSQVYQWKAALSTLGFNELIIGTDAAECAATLRNAINDASEGDGETRNTILPVNDSASAALEDGSTTSLLLTAHFEGLSGNDIALAETSTNFDITTVFVNGLDRGTQALEFPRSGLFDPNGVRVIGVPLKLKQACSEYAVRAHSAALYQDPTVDATGRAVISKREKVGPIETETGYEEGGSLSQLIKPYPAADRLLADYVFPAGRAFR